jgi:riboflavin kinase / FMN adenylyltransferase
LRGAVLAIGNFDGVHRGHRAVIAAAQKRARALGRKTAALTFTPHPRLFLRPQDTLFQLSSERDKLRLLAATGLDGAFVMTFDAALAGTSAEDFIARILVGRLGIGGAAIGFDFHFGKNRAGSPAFLAEQGAKLGFAVDIVPPLEDEGRPVSSGSIRTALAQGEVVEAAELLGAPWFASGAVIHGDKRGRELGFPTANIVPDEALVCPGHGVYAARAGGEAAAVNVGVRPTFGTGRAVLVEAYLIDRDVDLYGQLLTIEFLERLRGERRFDRAEALIAQMRLDVEQARAICAR